MSMQVRAGYINPLAVMDKSKTSPSPLSLKSETDSKEDLQVKRQQLENQMLLLKASGTDSAGLTEEAQQQLEAQLKEVTAALRSSKTALQPQEEAMQPSAAPRQDRFEHQEFAAFGSYQVERDENNGWQISFTPYSEN